MVFVEDDYVVEQLASDATYDALGISVLPWAAEGCALRVYSEALDRARNCG